MAHKHSIRPRGLLRTPAQHVCQHEGWFDDISDGPISATVKNSRATRRGDRERGVGNSLRPPDFSSYTAGITSIYDIVTQATGSMPSFQNDVLANTALHKLKGSRAHQHKDQSIPVERGTAK
jgi:hypothetical protein